jgi:hypothetical protein
VHTIDQPHYRYFDIVLTNKSYAMLHITDISVMKHIYKRMQCDVQLIDLLQISYKT